jgi:autophagy-related protein 5
LTDDLDLFNSVNNKLINPPGVTIRHVPMKIYLPSSAGQAASQTIPEEPSEDKAAATTTTGRIRVVQSLVPLMGPFRRPHTLGTALKNIVPTIFPSGRQPIYARPILHGVVAPMFADLVELARVASYADGFLHVAVIMMG